MTYSQRDIVEINFLFPDGRFKPHPAIIVSNDDLQMDEGFIYLCLISSKDYNSKYCFNIENEMLTKPMDKKSFVKCHIIVGNVERDVIKRTSRMKQPYFNRLVEKIKDSLF